MRLPRYYSGSIPFEVVRFPAIAEEEEVHRGEFLGGPIEFRRKPGDVLDPRREPLATLQQLKQTMSTYDFEAQYQQNPQPVGGAIIQTKWLQYYKPENLRRQFASIVQSWDTANKSGELNDYSVCTTWGVRDGFFHLLDVFRKRMDYPELKCAVWDQYRRFRPGFVIIEDKGSGTQLLQELAREGMGPRAYCPESGQDKKMHLFNQAGHFERGRILLPESAPWLKDYVRELTTFPGTKHDDQVDSTTQMLDYWFKNVHGYGCRITELNL